MSRPRLVKFRINKGPRGLNSRKVRPEVFGQIYTAIKHGVHPEVGAIVEFLYWGPELNHA
jgi:hypothetical protein